MNQNEKWLIIRRKALESCLVKIFDQFANTSIDPICIKGWSVARFYPDSRFRTYNDIDIVVKPADYQNTLKNLLSLRLKGIHVDVHAGIRDRDNLSWDDLFHRSYTAKLQDKDIRVLADEDNLRIIAAHWLIDGGVFKEKLWDIFYLVSNRRKTFDWDRCLNAAGPVRRTWVLSAIAAARDFIDLDVSDLSSEVKDFRLPTWYKRALERAWEREPVPRIPFLSCLRRPDLIVQQARRHFPPNPIAATTDTEGPIDDMPRWPYQVKSILKKLRNTSPVGRKG